MSILVICKNLSIFPYGEWYPKRLLAHAQRPLGHPPTVAATARLGWLAFLAGLFLISWLIVHNVVYLPPYKKK